MSDQRHAKILPPPLSTLAIGSVPFTDTTLALDLLAQSLDIPASPQMVKVSPWQDMILGAVSGLGALSVDTSYNVSSPLEGREEGLTEFFEKYMAGDSDFLALGPKASLGFEAFMSRARINPNFGEVFLKSQIVGPITFGQAVKVEGGNALVDDPALLEMVSLGLGGKAAWLAGKIRELGRVPMVFFDEPGLTGYGSAFSTLSSDMIVSALGGSVAAARAHGEVLVGCHVCGNTDWGLLTKVGLDIINFDAYEYMETICLYPREIGDFLDKGGLLAFGVVPTRDFTPDITAEQLADIVYSGWRKLASRGLDLDLLSSRTLLTSACGLGSLTEEQASSILRIMPEVAYCLAGLRPGLG
jgi:hypothetical protein